ncbi:outer membrane beta-barrel protein [Sphingobacterium sp. ML3W]|uniref:outer membrane beta-barrel protein n=1 Tax=Sphingobacterium sp. ML3W TaxID=1538644 RepID=UPI00249B1600|nr:outer membrane beta-barrel protein [Sphingobacterium sp. ML3W]WFA78679.1 outer membrane beta-barrel protein [Sphingobacterium sp. ML3W]
MKRLIQLFLLFFVISTAYSQTSIKGKILDKADNKPLTNASIILLNKDSVLRYFNRANEEGKFLIKNIKPGSYILLATYPKFELYSDTIDIKDKEIDLNDIKINSQKNVLEEVIITRRLPITLKGDTIEYDAASFATEKNAKLEDLFRRLPGFTVSGDGNITAQGKAVQKVFIDGEEFFGYDPKIAIRNVRADAVDKVQLYEKKSEEAELSGIDDGVRIQTVNVVLKEKARKGIFGNAELLGGTKELYAGNLFAAKFNQTERIGITANHNNMGSSNSREGSLRMNNQITGQPLNTSLGANYENQFLKKALKVNANYNYNNSSNKNQSENYNKNILPDNSILERNSKNYNENSARSNGVRSNLSMRLDSTQNLELQTNGNWSNNFSLSQSESATKDGTGAAVSSFNEKNESNTSSQSNNFRLNYRKRLKAGSSLNLMVGNNYNESTSDSKVNSETIIHQSNDTTRINQNRRGNNKGNNFSTSLNFNNRLNDAMNLALGYSFNQSNNRNEQISTDIETEEKDPLYSKNQIDNNTNQGVNVHLSYRKDKFEVNLSNRTFYKNQKLSDSDRDINLSRNFWDNNLNFDANYRISNSKNIRLAYQSSNIIPSFDQLQPLQPQTNPLFQQIGNPDLKRAVTNNISANYNAFSLLKGTNININGNFSFVNNPIVNKTTVMENSAQISSYENLSGKSNWNSGLNINHMQPLANRRINFNKSANIRYNNSYSYTKFESGQSQGEFLLNNSKNTSFSLGSSLNEQDSEGFDFDLSVNAGLNTQQNSINTQYNATNFEGGASGYIKYFLPKKFNIMTNVYYSYTGPTKLYKKSINQFYTNLELEKKVLKDESLTVSLKAFDLFNTFNNTRRNGSDTNYSESTQQVLTQYFLVGVKWDFNKYLGKSND